MNLNIFSGKNTARIFNFFIIAVLILISLFIELYAQTPYNPGIYQANKITLDNTSINNTTPLQEGHWEFKARDIVKLKYNKTTSTGFKFTAKQASPNSPRSFKAYVNKNQKFDVVYTPSGEVPDGSTRQLDLNLPVGTLKGSYSVTPSGGMAYTVPIYTPPGTNGMQPQISLVYNSQSGNGLLGYGWNLSGLSAISRTPKNPYFDNEISGIDLSSNDKFALDGNRLICTSGDYGGNQSLYNTEVEQFSRIKSFGLNTDNEPEYFTVQTKDGHTLYFGNYNNDAVNQNANVKSFWSNPSRVLMWRLSRIEDVNGNYIHFTYNNSDDNEGESWIQSIEYTGNDMANIAPYNIIEFSYDNRQDRNYTFTAGNYMRNNVILSRITVKAETTKVVRNYDSKYYLDLYSHLYDIQVSNENDIPLNSTLVNWYPPTNEEDILKTKVVYSNQLDASKNNAFIHGDFDGDGKTEIVLIQSDSRSMTLYANNSNNINLTGDFVQKSFSLPYGELPMWTNLYYELNNGQWTIIHDVNNRHDNPLWKADLVPGNCFSIDLNNDGLSDIIACCKVQRSRYDQGVFVYDDMGYQYVAMISTSTMNSYSFSIPIVFVQDPVSPYYVPGYSYTSLPHTNQPQVIKIGDFFGEQEVKILAFDKDNGIGSMLFYGPSAPATSSWYDSSPWFSVMQVTVPESMRGDNNILVGNFTGSGKTDILVDMNDGRNKRSQFKILTLSKVNGAIQFNDIYTEPAPSGGYNSRQRFNLLTGDFNGDGKTDILYHEVRFADDYTTLPPLWVLKLSTGTLNNFNFIGYDYSGFNLYTGIDKFAINRQYEELQNHDTYFYYKEVPCNRYAIVQTGDFNGDGKTDIFEILLNGASTEENDGTFVNIYYSYGDGFLVDHKALSKSDFPPINLNNGDYPQTYDFNGDGNADLLFDLMDLCYHDNTRYRSLFAFYIRAAEKNQLISSITDGLNNKINFEYELMDKMSQMPNYGGYTIPNNCRSSNSTIYILTSVNSLDNTLNTKNETKYRYGVPILHLKGKGFLGFVQSETEQTTKDLFDQPISQYNVFNGFDINPDFLYIFPKSTETKMTMDGITETLNTTLVENDAFSLGNKIYFPYTKKITTIDEIKHIKKETLITYENENNLSNFFGNVEAQTEYVYDYDNTTQTYYTTQYYMSSSENEYLQTNTNWWSRGSVIRNKESKELYANSQLPYSETAYSRLTNFEYYNDSRGLLKNKIVDEDEEDNVHDVRAIKEEYTYDVFGNLLTQTISAPNAHTSPTSDTDPPKPDNRMNSYVYDSYGRFAIRATNPIGIVTESEYDPCHGNVIAKYDANHLKTTYEYDDFGTLIKTTFPDGKISTFRQEYVKSGDNNYSIGAYSSLVKSVSTSINQPSKTVYYDSQLRELRTIVDGFGNTQVYCDKLYNMKGQNYKSSEPYEGPYNTNINWYENEYDRYERLTSKYFRPATGDPIHTQISFDDDEHTVTTTDPAGRSSTQKFDILGVLIESSDNSGDLIDYEYYNSGKLRKNTIKDNTSSHNVLSTVGMEYDLQGNQTNLTDVDGGETIYSYDAFGELYYQKDAENHVFKMHYDNVGRITEKIWPNGTSKTIYTYVSSGPGITQLESITAPDGASTSYQYDIYGRQIQVDEYTPDGSTSQTLTTKYEYSNYGSDKKVTYPSGLQVNYLSNSIGMLDKMSLINTSSTRDIYKITDVDEHGRVRAGNLHNTTSNEWSMQFKKDYNVYNALTDIQVFYGASPSYNYIQKEQYTYNNQNGNLSTRKDNKNSSNLKSESFEYDNLDRLTSITQGTTTKAITYYPNGNINSKFDVGNYEYQHPTKKHAVSDVSAGDGSSSLSHNIQSITYTSFKKIETIEEGDYNEGFQYGPSDERRLTLLYDGSTLIRKRFYAENYEKELLPGNIVREIHYIGSPSGLIAVYIKETNQPDKLYYVQTDRQGSIVGLTSINTDNTPHQEANYSYDAWGRPRNPDDWTYQNAPSFNIISRGYTYHEHMTEFSLINMNGRLYDPMLARFLSPDNFVQLAGNPQSYNRYSYCLNNPLKYTDPSGQNPAILLEMAWAAFISASVDAITQYLKTGNVNWTHVAASAVQGALSCGLDAVIGNIPGIIPGAAYGAAKEWVLNGIGNRICGEKFSANEGSSIISGLINGARAGYKEARKTKFRSVDFKEITSLRS